MAERGLTPAQVKVLRLFFRLPASQGFALAGGAGLVAVGLSDRPTGDVDLFAPTASISDAGEAFETAARSEGWTVDRLRVADTFRRLNVRIDGEDETMVDLAQDAGPLGEPTITAVGPTYPARELAARKLLALFDRAALRDFIDVDQIRTRHSAAELIETAGAIDEGFDVSVLVQMLTGLDRFGDEQIQEYGVDPEGLRKRFRTWTDTLSNPR